MLTHFNDDDNAEPIELSIDLNGFGGDNGTEIEFFVLDESKDLVSAAKAVFYGDRFSPVLTVPNLTSCS